MIIGLKIIMPLFFVQVHRVSPTVKNIWTLVLAVVKWPV